MATYQLSQKVINLLNGTTKHSARFKNGLDRLLNKRTDATENVKSAAVDLFDLIQEGLGPPTLSELDPEEDLGGEKAYLILGDFALGLVDIGLQKSNGKIFQKGPSRHILVIFTMSWYTNANLRDIPFGMRDNLRL